MLPNALELKRAMRHLRKADTVMARIIRQVGPCRLKAVRRGSDFEALVESIVYQQITGKAAYAIHQRLRQLLGGTRLAPADLLKTHARRLRSVGLSRQKIGYLRDLSRRALDGLALDRLGHLDDEAVISALTTVKGIGRWTAEMFLIFRLGRLDVLPVSDYGLLKAVQKAYGGRGLPKPHTMRRVGEAWKPYRSVACWYLWRSITPDTGRA